MPIFPHRLRHSIWAEPTDSGVRVTSGNPGTTTVIRPRLSQCDRFGPRGWKCIRSLQGSVKHKLPVVVYSLGLFAMVAHESKTNPGRN